MARKPCKQCPFREGSEFCYDEDAKAALDDGNTPACHMVVGEWAVFQHAPMDPPKRAECRGHSKWLDGEPGFKEPSVIKNPENTKL